MRWSTVPCTLVLITSAAHAQYYDTFTGREINQTRYEAMDRTGLAPLCAMRLIPCNPHAPRRVDMSCNNLRYPTRGAAFTPYTRMLPPVFAEGGGLRRARSGRALPLVRPLRVALMSDGRSPSARFTNLMVNYHVFVSSDVTSAHDTVNYVGFTTTCCQPGGEQNPQCIPIQVPDDDLHLRRSSVRCLNLTRAITYQRLGCVSDEVPLERINGATPMLDLSTVYGNEESVALRGRELTGGRLRADILNGKEWPPTGGAVCVNNVPPRETRCHDIPTPGSNSLMGINLLFMWYYRSHNAIADALRLASPCWDDDRLYYTAREINIAYSAQIFYYDVMPDIVGWEFLASNKIVFETEGHVDDYDPALEPRLSIEYPTFTRTFHAHQEGTWGLYLPDGRRYGSFQTVDLILRTGVLPLDGNLAGLTQGSFRQPGAAIDDLVDPDMGERVLGRLQFASDVISSDIMKGRDFGLPPYNQYRKACGLPEATRFKDLLGWMGRQQVEALATFYEHPDDIDVMAALLAENPMPGSALGSTLSCIMAEQMLRWRRADRFWFEHSIQPGAFTQEQLREIRKMTLSKLLCLHGDSVTAIQPRAILLPGDGNEITNCSEYDMPDLSVFRDGRCYPHPMPRDEEHQHPMPRHKEYKHPMPRVENYPMPPDERTTLNNYPTFRKFDTNHIPIHDKYQNPYSVNVPQQNIKATRPAVRNGDYPFEEFLQNYWQSSSANPFKAYLG